MEWIAMAFMTILAIVLHSPSDMENKKSDDRHNNSTKS